MPHRITLVAAPLVARSGVYNSTIELVHAARQRGLDWTAAIGVSRAAAGEPSDVDGIYEFEWEPRGIFGVLKLRQVLRSLETLSAADLVISMLPQTDMALSLQSKPWVAYLRGLPWPAAGEASAFKTLLWQALERHALRRAIQVWATTPTLTDEVGVDTVDRIVPPGLTPPNYVTAQGGDADLYVWAARYDADKNPMLFIDALRGTSLSGIMYGTGPLENELALSAPENVSVAGWGARDEIWRFAKTYVGTSTREAFGRSAVEAAMLGLPVIISKAFGCAPLLFTDHDLARRFVLELDNLDSWSAAMQALDQDAALWQRTAEHVKLNADKLTVDSAVDSILAAASNIPGAE